MAENSYIQDDISSWFSRKQSIFRLLLPKQTAVVKPPYPFREFPGYFLFHGYFLPNKSLGQVVVGLGLIFGNDAASYLASPFSGSGCLSFRYTQTHPLAGRIICLEAGEIRGNMQVVLPD